MKPFYRRCISCSKVASKDSFWRIVKIYPSAKVELDQGMGRSAYICPQGNCLRSARQKNRLGRALKTAIPQEIYEILLQRLINLAEKESSLETNDQQTRKDC